MRDALSNLLSLALASLAVGLVWAVVSLTAAGRMNLAEFLAGWPMISGFVFGIAVLPAALLILIFTRNGPPTLIVSILAAALLGAALFFAFFFRWVGSNAILETAQLLASGAGLGAIGGASYWASMRKFMQRAPRQTEHV